MIDSQKERILYNPLISVIVPVYKVEKYLDRCVQSIIAQTYKNIEVFLVDDGSPDNCGKMCDEYAEKNAFIHVIHQANAGQAAARNHAVKFAQGEFIAFIDSDDFAEPDCLEYLVSLQKKHHADMVIGGFSYLFEDREPSSRELTKEHDILLNATETLVKMNYNQGFGATPWAKIYKKELIIQHPFPEGQIYEDLATLYKIVGDCDRIAVGNRRIYYWVQRAGSTMRMTFDERQMAGMDAASAQIAYIEKKYPSALKSAKYRYTAKAVELTAACFNSGGDKTVFRRLRKLMKVYAKEVLQDKHAKTTMKLRMIAMSLGYYPAKIVFGLHERAKKQLI